MDTADNDDLTLARAKAHALADPGGWVKTTTPTQIDRRHGQRTRPMEVLCLGRERTGTLSLRVALLQLGYYDVYHMSSVLIENPIDCEMWNDALDAKFKPTGQGSGEKKPFGRKEWDALLGHCAAVTDQPCAAFGEELMQAYPEAKVILTVRDSPQAWHRSLRNTILPTISMLSPYHIRHPGWNPFYHLQRFLAPKMPGHPSSQDFFDKAGEALDGDMLHDEEEATKIYHAHNQHIRDLARQQGSESQFLEFNVKQGWEPLCAFLGKPVPDTPFPRVNDTVQQQEVIKQLYWMIPLGYFVNALKVFGPPALALGAWWTLKKR